MLVKSGCSVNLPDVPFDPCKFNRPAPILSAAENGLNEVLPLLIVSDADLDITDELGNTPLTLSVTKGHFNCVAELIREGATVNFAKDKNPLSLAINGGMTSSARYQMTDLLITSGCSENMAPSPICTGVIEQDIESVEWLITAKANVNIPHPFYGTALVVSLFLTTIYCLWFFSPIKFLYSRLLSF